MSSVTLHPSDLTDAEWEHVKSLLPASKATGRPRQWPLRLILDGIFYLVRSGCSWRMLPKPYPPWPTVHDYYRRWRQDGTWERIHSCLREKLRRCQRSYVARWGEPPHPAVRCSTAKASKPRKKGRCWCCDHWL